MKTFPLTGWQAYLAALEKDPVGNDGLVRQITMSAATRIKPGFSERRISRAFSALATRHDVIRSQFRVQRGRATLAILDRHPLGVSVQDYGETPEDAITQIAQRKARELIRMDDTATVRLDLLKFGSQGDVVVFRAHHGITDGFGVTVAVEDFISMLLGVPSIRAAVPYATYMKRWGSDPQNDADIQFWEEKLRAPPPPLNLGRVRRGLPLLEGNRGWQKGKSLSGALSQTQIGAIDTASKEAGVTPFMLVNAAYLQAVAVAAEADDVIYSSTVGRSDAVLSTFAGHHTLHPLFRLRGLRDTSLADCARAAAADFVATLAHLPAPAARRMGSWDRRLTAQGSYPRQISTGTSKATARLEGSAYAIGLSREPGEVQRVGGFEITTLPMPDSPRGLDELNFRPTLSREGGVMNFSYDAEAFEEAEMEALVQATYDRLGLRLKRKQWLEKSEVV